MNNDQKQMDCINGCVTLLLRLTVGLVFFTAGLNKVLPIYAPPESQPPGAVAAADPPKGKIFPGVTGFTSYIETQYKDTVLPNFSLKLFGYALPFAEVIIGALLLAGLFTAETFFGAALLFIVLMWGQLLIGKSDVASRNTLFVLVAILGLRWSNANCCSLDCWRKSKGDKHKPPTT